MSEVKRYWVHWNDQLYVADKNGDLVMAEDFDRVTAERDELQRLLDHKEQQRESELRNGQAGDRLVGLLRRVVESSVLSFEQDAPEGLESLEADICAALKPVNGDCHHGYASILECPECGEPYQ